MKKIVTFQVLDNILEKWVFNRDVWQIWYTVKMEKWYESEVWCLKTKDQTDFVIKWQKWYWSINKITLYFKLLIGAKNINILHLYHIIKPSFIASIIYKLLNPKWIIYVKMDTPLFSWKIDHRIEALKINKIILNIFFKIVNYIWFEDIILLNFFKKKFPKYKNKFILTTSWAIKIDKFINNIPKEKSIVLCWTFWRRVKNNELLLKTLKNYNTTFLKDWQFILIWNYTNNFLKKYKELLHKKPELNNRIIFKWYINEKSKVYQEISKSKIFLHTSNSEWDPNIQYDSMFCGCYIISTDVGNIKQNYPSQYSIFYENNEKDLYNSLYKLVKKTDSLKQKDYLNIQKYCLDNFTWEKSLKNILNKI